MASSESTLTKRVLSAVFFGVSSFLIIMINKDVLTINKFPSFLFVALGQMTATLVVLWSGRTFGLITVPVWGLDTLPKIWPLPLFYLGNMLFGLGGTQALSLPMLIVLRRFTVLLVMFSEYLVLNQKPSRAVQLSVYLMMLGAIVAAINDLSFNLKGYFFVLMNDLCTAGNSVVMKQKLEAKNLGKYGLLFYNAFYMILPTLLVTDITDELDEALRFEGWTRPLFVAKFVLSCVFGFVLMYATMLCTHHNSALTTNVVGSIKNIFTTYIGMFVGNDYVFSWANFVGINISVMGSIIYSRVAFVRQRQSVISNRDNAKKEQLA